MQSHVQAHAELTWLLSCVTPISWLNKMIQFKEKARKSVRYMVLLLATSLIVVLFLNGNPLCNDVSATAQS